MAYESNRDRKTKRGRRHPKYAEDRRVTQINTRRAGHAKIFREVAAFAIGVSSMNLSMGDHIIWVLKTQGKSIGHPLWIASPRLSSNVAGQIGNNVMPQPHTAIVSAPKNSIQSPFHPLGSNLPLNLGGLNVFRNSVTLNEPGEFFKEIPASMGGLNFLFGRLDNSPADILHNVQTSKHS